MHRSGKSYVVFGLRILCGVVAATMLFYKYRGSGVRGLIGDSATIAFVIFFNYAFLKRATTTTRNMADVQPYMDRDEAQPARKAIDTRN